MKTKNIDLSNIVVGTLSSVVTIIGIIIFWLSSIIVDAEKVLKLPKWVGLNFLILG